MSPGVIDYLFISRNVGVQLLVFVAGDVDCFVLLIYTYISFSSRQTRSIVLGGRSASEKEPRVCRKRRREIEASRSNGIRRSYTLATAEETETIYVHVSPYTECTHAEILRTPTGQISNVTRYSVLVPRRSAASIITCNSKHSARARGITSTR